MKLSLACRECHHYISVCIEAYPVARDVCVNGSVFVGHHNEVGEDAHEELGGFWIENNGARHGCPFRKNG